jgi:hypothetical protein
LKVDWAARVVLFSTTVRLLPGISGAFLAVSAMTLRTCLGIS